MTALIMFCLVLFILLNSKSLYMLYNLFGNHGFSIQLETKTCQENLTETADLSFGLMRVILLMTSHARCVVLYVWTGVWMWLVQHSHMADLFKVQAAHFCNQVTVCYFSSLKCSEIVFDALSHWGWNKDLDMIYDLSRFRFYVPPQKTVILIRKI